MGNGFPGPGTPAFSRFLHLARRFWNQTCEYMALKRPAARAPRFILHYMALHRGCCEPTLLTTVVSWRSRIAKHDKR